VAYLREFNKKRKKRYKKDDKEEDFLLNMNRILQKEEYIHYRNYDIKYPFIFIFGLPRSGTTLISQLIANCFAIGYINNLIARFWLAPLHGIKLSKSVLGDMKRSNFQSDYAKTQYITDIHEFGYFWRFWLKKETLEDITMVKQRERKIDWDGLKKVLSTLQNEFDKPMVFKNIFGSYHLKKMKELLEKIIYIYIERDELDTAISILDARKKYYDDINTWWSYAPVEYNKLKNLQYMEQIAGQIYYLKKFYNDQIKSLDGQSVLKVRYESLCKNPRKILKDISEKSKRKYGYELKLIKEPPSGFKIRTYYDRNKQKKKFLSLIKKFGSSPI